MKVVDLKGGYNRDVSEPDTGLLEMLEEITAAVKDGRYLGVAFAITKADGTVGTLWSNERGGAIPMLAAITLLQRDYLRGMDEE